MPLFLTLLAFAAMIILLCWDEIAYLLGGDDDDYFDGGWRD